MKEVYNLLKRISFSDSKTDYFDIEDKLDEISSILEIRGDEKGSETFYDDNGEVEEIFIETDGRNVTRLVAFNKANDYRKSNIFVAYNDGVVYSKYTPKTVNRALDVFITNILTVEDYEEFDEE